MTEAASAGGPASADAAAELRRLRQALAAFIVGAEGDGQRAVSALAWHLGAAGFDLTPEINALRGGTR